MAYEQHSPDSYRIADLSAFQRIVVLIAIAIIAIIFIAATTLLFNFKHQLPPVPVQGQNINADEFKKVIGNYKDLTAALQSNTNEMSDVLIKPMSAIFTSIIASVLAFVFSKSVTNAIGLWLHARARARLEKETDLPPG